MTWRIGAALGALLAASATTGCGGGGDDDLLVSDGPVVAWHLDAEPDAMAAFVGGTLVVEGGCVLLDDEEEGTTPIVWPRDTTWDEDRKAVVTTDGTRLIAGDPVMVGGGYVGIDDDTEVASTARELLDGDCDPSSDQLVVANLDSDVGPIG